VRALFYAFDFGMSYFSFIHSHLFIVLYLLIYYLEVHILVWLSLVSALILVLLFLVSFWLISGSEKGPVVGFCEQSDECFELHKMFWSVEQLLASKKGICSMDLDY
jgi:hypothetical protein